MLKPRGEEQNLNAMPQKQISAAVEASGKGSKVPDSGDGDRSARAVLNAGFDDRDPFMSDEDTPKILSGPNDDLESSTMPPTSPLDDSYNQVKVKLARVVDAVGAQRLPKNPEHIMEQTSFFDKNQVNENIPSLPGAVQAAERANQHAVMTETATRAQTPGSSNNVTPAEVTGAQVKYIMMLR